MPNLVRGTVSLAALALAATLAHAGGSPENALLIINPGSAESMYLGNYYKNARNIPDRNILYIEPGPDTYSEAAGLNGSIDAVFGALRNRQITDHIDYIILASTPTSFLFAANLVNDGCWPVARFSPSSVYTNAFIRPQILAGNNPSTGTNHYYSTGAPVAFSSKNAWLFGSPSTSGSAARYFIGAHLGYTGANGNTVAELLAMIDRSVAADNTRPSGTFYFMNTTDPARNVRATQFQGAINSIISAGGAAMLLNGILPEPQQDCLGIMTGWADPAVETGNFTLKPGAFADHLTSWAATFYINDQTKVSSWIRKGASGSAGAVEEPCNYTGKFPHATFHNSYFRGLSLGESWLRSVGFIPYQGLLYGDPLTRPFATFPVVSASPPAGPVGGTVVFTPAASTPLPNAAVATLDLLIDGVYHSTRNPGQSFSINTVPLADGPHELRILATDNTPIKNTGRWIGTLNVNNYNRTVNLSLGVATGSMTTLFSPQVTSSGAAVSEVRLLHNGRVVAAAPTTPATLPVYGRNLGSGQSSIQAEVTFADGIVALSQKIPLNISYTVGAFSNLPPVAYSYTKRVARGGAFTVELPASFDDGYASVTYTIVTPPSQGTTVGNQPKSYRTMTASPTACGADQFTFRVDTPSGQSNTATVTLIYGPAPACPADFDNSGQTNINDFIFFQNAFAVGDLRADVDGSCLLNINDFITFLNIYATGCP